jgi:WD40 repeat protein
MAGFAAAAVIAAGFAVVANQERHRAEVEASVNRSQVLAAAAIEAMGEDDQLALLLGLEAADVSLEANGEVLPEAAGALHRSLRASRLEAAVSLDSLPMGRTVLLAASSSGLVAVSSTGDTVELRRGDDIGTVVATLGVPLESADTGVMSAPGFAPDGASVAVVGSDGTLRVWDVESGIEIWSQPHPEYRVGGVVYSPDGAWLLSSDVSTLVMWDAVSAEAVWTTEYKESLGGLPAFSPDGSRLAVGTWGSGGLVILDTGSGMELSKLNSPAAVGSLFWSPDGTRLFVGLIGGDIHVVDTAALGEVETWQDAVVDTIEGHGATPVSMAIDYSGTRLAAGADDGTIRIWDLATGGELMVLGASAGSVAFLPDDQHLVATGNDRLLRRYDVSPEGRGEILAADTGGEEFASIDISPDGTKLAALTWWGEWNPAGVIIWDIASGSPQLTIDGVDWWSFDGVTFANDGQGFVVQDWDESQEPTDTVGEGWGPVQLRDATTGQVLISFAETAGQERQTPVFSADGSVLATGSTASLTDVAKRSGRRRPRSTMPPPVSCCTGSI